MTDYEDEDEFEGDEDFDDDSEDFDEWSAEEGDEFADPGGRSALRAASPSNPRIHPCPTCGAENVLTLKDVKLGYQCDGCADRAEGGGY